MNVCEFPVIFGQTSLQGTKGFSLAVLQYLFIRLFCYLFAEERVLCDVGKVSVSVCSVSYAICFALFWAHFSVLFLVRKVDGPPVIPKGSLTPNL